MIQARTAFPSALVALALLAAGCGESAPDGASKPAAVAAAKSAPDGAKAPAGAGAAKGGKGAKGTASAVLAYQTGQQLLLKGDPKKAETEFERAVGLDPRMSEALYELGKLEVHLSSQNVGSQARDLDVLDKGIAALEKARDLEPSNDQYWFWVGRARFLKNDTEGAMTNLKKAVELNPKHAGAWKALGIAQKGHAQTEDARASFQKAIESDPKDAGSFFQLGQSLEELNDLANARAAYEKSIALDPTEPDVFGRLLKVCATLGDSACEARARAGMESWTEYDKQLQQARRKVNQNPGDPKALRRLGIMYFDVAKWEEALEWFMKSIHIDPKDAKTHLYCGATRRHLKDFVTAANHLKEAEFLAPDNLDPKLELLRLYADSEDTASLEELLGKIEGEAAADGSSLYALGEVMDEIGRKDDAARLYGKAKELGVTAPAASAPADAEGK
jgi:tetratricopeptide (TPR) repeat protein